MSVTSAIDNASLAVIICCLLAVIGCLIVVLQGRRRSTPVSVLYLLGVLVAAAVAAMIVTSELIPWQLNWGKSALLAGLALLIGITSAALLRLLPRAIAFQAAENFQAAADELNLSKDRFQRAIDGSLSGLWEWNVQENNVWYSARFRELLGYGCEDNFPDTPESWMSLVHPDDLATFLNALNTHFTDQRPYDIEYRMQTRAGDYRWFNARGLAISDPEGIPYLMSGSIHDIHDRKLAEEAVRRRDAYLNQKRKLEAVGELAEGTAHEFNNMLQAISGQIQLAERTLPASSEVRKELAVASQLIAKSKRFTDQLLNLGAPQIGEATITNVREIVEQLAQFIRPMLGSQIRLTLALSDEPGVLLADSVALEQALLNLCINSRDAMPDGGELVIRTENVQLTHRDVQQTPDLAPGAYLLITVSDTGCGMTEEARARIFEPFFTTKEVGKGTGLGLALAYSVVSECKGNIQVESSPGKGATFSIWLPLVDSVSPPAQDVPAKPKKVRPAKILYAEDNEASRRTTAELLKQRHQVYAAADGQEALRLFLDNQKEIDLAVLDVVMPKLRGDDVYHYLRRRRPELPVILCSAYATHQTIHDIVKLEHARFIDKPYDPDALLTLIDDTLSLQSKQELAQE